MNIICYREGVGWEVWGGSDFFFFFFFWGGGGNKDFVYIWGRGYDKILTSFWGHFYAIWGPFLSSMYRIQNGDSLGVAKIQFYLSIYF